MATLVEVNGVRPTIGVDVWLAPTAVLIGDVRVGDRASVWFGAVIRADFDYIEVGQESSIQDNAVLHVAPGLPTIVGRRVTVGHGALVEGCVIEDGALIGMGAVVLHNAQVGRGAMLAAGAVVPERVTIAPGVLAAGVPAREKKQLDGASARWTSIAADDYQDLRRNYLSTAIARPYGDLPASTQQRDEESTWKQLC
jgi:carbonic anhydrase/acetyltransferase-like protein (isoleucine patch superfamily)